MTERDFIPLKDNHVNWITLIPFGWQKEHNTPKVHLVTKGRIYWGETDIGLKETIRLAQKHNLKILLKPHIWLSDSNNKWRSEIRMKNDRDWQKWFRSYETFIFHYAKMAAQFRLEAFCIGTELRSTLHRQEWLDLVRKVRSIYKGKLTYAANWYKEFTECRFWGELDYIGVQGYFPIAKKKDASVEDMKEMWQPHIRELHKISQQYDKPILFTEIGYKSSPKAAISPWEWPSSTTPVDFSVQQKCYEALFQTIWQQPWFLGIHVWKWYPHLVEDKRNPKFKQKRFNKNNPGFSPQYKPAQKTIRRWFRKSQIITRDQH